MPAHIVETDMEKFDRYTPDRPGNGACWLWKWGGSALSYPTVYVQKRPMRANRFAFCLHNRALLPGEVVRHSCDVPSCVNPAHLLPGTSADNARDKVERGRQPRGEAVLIAKLTELDVQGLRRSTETSAAAARRLGVNASTVKRARGGLTWKHVP